MIDNSNPVRGGHPWLALLVMSMFLQASCSSVSQTRDALRTAEVCCDDFAAMSFPVIHSVNPSDTPVVVELNDRSPVYPFRTGKSYFSEIGRAHV